ncbi:hypothetical protein [Streptomyces sp. NPDC001781]
MHRGQPTCGRFAGHAFAWRDVAAFPQKAGLRDRDELDAVRSELIECRGGGPEHRQQEDGLLLARTAAYS